MKKKQLFKVWCEWDIGLENDVFDTKEEALKQAKKSLKKCGIDDDFDELIEDGLVGTTLLNKK